MYLLLITFGMCLTYICLFFLFSFFFKNTITPLNRTFLYSFFYIIIFSFIVFSISFGIPNHELGNRILHTFGGGFLSFFVCFLVVKDSNLQIRRFQFFVFSFLIAMSLGIFNEIIEFFLQNYAHIIFAITPHDTWLDLMSNCLGALIASICFVPFVKNAK